MVGENADHIIAGEGSVDAAHSKSFVYIGHIYLLYRPGAHGAVGAALAAPTLGPKMGVSIYVGVSDVILIYSLILTIV